VVEHLTHNPKIEDLNLITGTRREKTAIIRVYIFTLNCSLDIAQW
jgi:hypothetical protein